MKIQELAIIFVIIILPISLALSSYTQFQIQTINTQTLYDSRLTSATYDALKAFQLNSSNSTTSDLSNSKIRDLEASVETFRNSIMSTFELNGYTEEDLNNYIPALVYTLYDGFYIYSPYTNTNYRYETQKNTDGTDKTDAYGNVIYDTSKPIDDNGEKLYGLKPYVTYSCRYIRSNIDVVITYALDNHITVQGTIGGEYVNKGGYLVEDITYNESTGKVTYNGVEIKNESLKEYLPLNGGKEYPYIKLNGVKYYEVGNKIVSLLNGTLSIQCDGGKDSTTFVVWHNLITKNSLGKEYYEDAKEFTDWFKSKGLNALEYGDAYDTVIIENAANKSDNGKIEMQKIWSGDNRKIFQFGTSTNIENELSSFNQHRLSIIRHKIETNLAIAIANYNDHFSVSTYSFEMPKLKEDEWDYVTHNISLISFLQGLPIVGKTYNGYSIVTDSESEEVVLEEDIYLLGYDNKSGNREYCRIGDQKIKNGDVDLTSEYYIGDSSSQSAGRLNLDFERKTITNDNVSYYYYPLREYDASYNSIVMQNEVDTYDDIYAYLDEQSIEYKTVFYTALGRERQSKYMKNNLVTKSYAGVISNSFCNVILNPTGGAIPEGKDSGIVIFNDKYGDLLSIVPTRKGYRFLGWYTGTDGTGEKITENSVCRQKGTITLYAYWELIGYELIYRDCDNNVVRRNTIHYQDNYPAMPTINVPAGKYIIGWYDQFGREIHEGDTFVANPEAAEYYITPKLDNITYTLTFNANGGTVSKTSQRVTYSERYGKFGNFPTPTRTGYTFSGWYTASSGGTQVTENTIYNIAGNSTIYAHWTANTYTVYFNANGGSVNPNSKSVRYDSQYGDLPTPTKSGYLFLGWYTDSNGGSQITNTSIYKTVGNITLYAHWKANTYTIAYNLNGGSFGSSHPTTVSVDSSFTVSNPTQSGWTFTGWTITGMDNSTHTYGSSTTTSGTINSTKATTFKNLRTSSGTVTFTAHWSRTVYGSGTSGGNNRGAMDASQVNTGSSSSVVYRIDWGYTFNLSSFGYGGLNFYLQGRNDGGGWVTLRQYASWATGHNSGTDWNGISGYKYFRAWKDGTNPDSWNWDYEGGDITVYWYRNETK